MQADSSWTCRLGEPRRLSAILEQSLDSVWGQDSVSLGLALRSVCADILWALKRLQPCRFQSQGPL
eukprot:2790388-Amphidinium_carterae.1